MIQVAIVYHSGFGHTRKLAEAVHAGADSVDGVESRLCAIPEDGSMDEADWEFVDGADAIVFGSPTYMGMVSAAFKRFAEDSSKRWYSQAWKDKLAAGFTNSASMNGDKHSTLHYMITLAMQHGMLWVGPGMKPANTKNSQRNDLNYLGAYAGVMAQSPADASAEEAPCDGDLLTARSYGERIAQVTHRWKGG